MVRTGRPLHHALYSRRYRAALLDYLLDATEQALSRAHELGRMAIDENLGLLTVLRTHQEAVRAVLESAPDHDRNLNRLHASQSFLMETLSVFEMTHRGYVALIGGDDPDVAPQPTRRRTPRPH